MTSTATYARRVALTLAMLSMVACAPAPDDQALPGFGALLLQTTLLLVVVSLLAVISLRLAARHGRLGPGATRHMEVLERLSLGGRQSIIALKVGERVVIVGQSPTGLQPISELEDHPWSHRSPSEPSAEPRLNAFARMLASPAVRARAAAYTPAPDPSDAPSDPSESADKTTDEELIA